MKHLVLAGSLLLAAANASAQRSFRFSSSASSAAAEDPNYFSGMLGIGGFDIGVTVGPAYERILGDRGLFSIQLPLGYSSSRDNFLGVAGDGDRFHRYKSFFVAPGLFYHPSGAFQRTDFSIGMQLACGPLLTAEDYYRNSSVEKTTYNSLFLAPLAATNVNVRGKYSNSLFGFHFAIGPVLAGNYGLLFDGRENNSPVFVQVGIRLGGSF